LLVFVRWIFCLAARSLPRSAERLLSYDNWIKSFSLVLAKVGDMQTRPEGKPRRRVWAPTEASMLRWTLDAYKMVSIEIVWMTGSGQNRPVLTSSNNVCCDPESCRLSGWPGESVTCRYCW